ncbi:MAG: tetratricopeptide repeat protein [Phycisphaerae bacterium]|nr:tetratricopeptide repeat protein [Phycisphaerae bacterium]
MENQPREKSVQRWNGVRGDVTLRLAEQHFSAGRLVEAEATLNKVMAMSPESAEVFKFAARLYLERGQLAKAKESVVAAIHAPGADAECEYLAGIIEERYGELDAALSHYVNALNQKPNTPEYVLATAELYIATDDPHRALELLLTRVKDFDDFPTMSVLAAQVCRMLGLTDDAVNFCRQALPDFTDDAAVRAELGTILAWAGRHSEAIQALQPIVDRSVGRGRKSHTPSGDAKQPIPASVRRVLADSYLALGRGNEARRILRTVMADDSADAHAWTLFCRSAINDGELRIADEAIQTFNRRSAPTAETVLLEGYVSLLRGRPEMAQKLAERAIAMDASLEEARLLCAEALRTMGAFDAARRVCREAVAAGRPSAALTAFLAELSLVEEPAVVKDIQPAPATAESKDPRKSGFTSAFGMAAVSDEGEGDE